MHLLFWHEIRDIQKEHEAWTDSEESDDDNDNYSDEDDDRRTTSK